MPLCLGHKPGSYEIVGPTGGGGMGGARERFEREAEE